MPGLAEAFERIGSALEHHLPVSHAAGAAIAVTDRHETLGVVVRGFADVASGAPVRPETRFMIGSISKSFAAIVVLQEVEAGRLDLHVSVNELLPWLELPEPFGPITLHHLLTHTSGLAAGTEDAPTGLGVATLLRERAADVPAGSALLVLERRVQARGARAGARDLDAGARADPSARPGAARNDLVGGGDHGGHPDGSRHGLRAGVHRSSGAAAPPAWSRRSSPCRARSTVPSCRT